jgi:copper oxidase (laccase) domain-containing protein
MAETITKDNLFRAARPGPQTKADLMDSAARAIMKAEADSREAKTQRLRQARLEMEAQRSVPVPAKCTAKKAKKFVSHRAA